MFHIILLVIYPENPNNQLFSKNFALLNKLHWNILILFMISWSLLWTFWEKIKAPEKSGDFQGFREVCEQYFSHPPHFQRVLEVIPQLQKKVGPRRVRSAKVTDQKTDMWYMMCVFFFLWDYVGKRQLGFIRHMTISHFSCFTWR